MEVMLKIGIPFSVVLVIIGSCINLGGKFKQELISRINGALVCFTFCFIDFSLLALGPIEIQAKKYTIALSMALSIYIGALIFNLIRALLAYSDMKEVKSEHACLQRMKVEGGGEKDGRTLCES